MRGMARNLPELQPMTLIHRPAPSERTTSDHRAPKSGMMPMVHASLRSSRHSQANRRQARAMAWKWAASRWPRLVPAQGEIDADHMERALPGQALLVSTSQDGRSWTLSVAHGERHGSRTWATEAIVSDTGSADRLTVRTACSDLGQLPPVVAPPRLLGTWVERLDLDDAGLPVLAEPRIVNHPTQLEAFFEQVLSRGRQLPVIALASRPRSQFYGIDPRALAQAVRGIAHVTCIPAAMAPEVARTLGEPFGVAHGAARLFAAGFHPDDAAREHPLLRSPRADPADPESAPGSFRKTVCRVACALSVRART